MYADRGLVKRGDFNNLFNILYINFIAFLTLWATSVGYVYNFDFPNGYFEPQLANVCVRLIETQVRKNRVNINLWIFFTGRLQCGSNGNTSRDFVQNGCIFHVAENDGKYPDTQQAWKGSCKIWKISAKRYDFEPDLHPWNDVLFDLYNTVPDNILY